MRKFKEVMRLKIYFRDRVAGLGVSWIRVVLGDSFI